MRKISIGGKTGKGIGTVANAGGIKEGDFLQQVIDLAHLFGWKVAHFRPAMIKNGWCTPVAADGKGFPDLVLAKKGFAPLFWELKREKGKVSSGQQSWLDILGGRVLYPSDFDYIQATLSSKHSEPGFPDLFMVRPTKEDEFVKAVALECKMPGQKPTKAQAEWIALLGRAPGIKARVVYPVDLEKIREWLK